MKIAIVGSGISGLGAAYFLRGKHEVILYEKERMIGGHARTVRVHDRTVDVAVNVFSDRDYPNVMKFFRTLGVPLRRARMSFGFSGMLREGKFEWASHSFLSQTRNMLSPRFWRMCSDAFRFYATIGKREIAPTATFDELFDDMHVSTDFRDYWLLPMMSAVWSCPGAMLRSLPARFFIDFFKQHGLFNPFNLPTWYNIPGGCRTYLDILSKSLEKEIRLGSAVSSVKRGDHGVLVTTATEAVIYDAVIFACHPREVLALLSDAEEPERTVLGGFRFYDNEVYVHTDVSVMPGNRACWSSWIYELDETKNTPVSSTSYWVNGLQNLDHEEDVFVTLNPLSSLREDSVLYKESFSHPIYDFTAIEAQKKLPAIQGVRNIWYCGAWCGYGFHEDGLRSALEIVRNIDPSIVI